MTQHYVAFAGSRTRDHTRVQSRVDAGDYDNEWKESSGQRARFRINGPGKKEREPLPRTDFHRFFVQNLEEVALEGPGTLEIRVQSEIASF